MDPSLRRPVEARLRQTPPRRHRHLWVASPPFLPRTDGTRARALPPVNQLDRSAPASADMIVGINIAADCFVGTQFRTVGCALGSQRVPEIGAAGSQRARDQELGCRSPASSGRSLQLEARTSFRNDPAPISGTRWKRWEGTRTPTIMSATLLRRLFCRRARTGARRPGSTGKPAPAPRRCGSGPRADRPSWRARSRPWCRAPAGAAPRQRPRWDRAGLS